jgi:hypothetical protein
MSASIYIAFWGRILLVLCGLHTFFNTLFTGYASLVHPTIVYIFSIAVGFSALMFVFDRNYYLPFLGPCVIPTIHIDKSPVKKPLTSVTLTDLPPGANVVYWASISSDNVFDSYKDAYGDYANSGLARVSENGTVSFNISCPSQYSVKKFGVVKSQLPRHVHYRYETPGDRGMYSQIFTKNITKC